ncbi:MAG: hypothetical protein KAR06_03335 [Deltaproteobacteria bacterium]|nr:hypothetical protein [Deltaproteobacteria bacterium]
MTDNFTDKLKLNKARIFMAVIFAVSIVYVVAGLMGDDGKGYDGVDVKKMRQARSLGAKDRLSLPELNDVMLEAADKVKPKYTGIKKDIFRPLSVKVKPKPVIIEPKVLETVPVKEATPLEGFVSEVGFSGFLERHGEMTTVFISRGDEVYFVKAGDIIDERFKIFSIEAEEVKFIDIITGEVLSVGAAEE